MRHACKECSNRTNFTASYRGTVCVHCGSNNVEAFDDYVDDPTRYMTDVEQITELERWYRLA